MARSRPSRVTKPTSSSSSSGRLTRHRSRLASISASSYGLQNMVDEVSEPVSSVASSVTSDRMVEDTDVFLEHEGSVQLDCAGMVLESQSSEGTTSSSANKGKGRLTEPETAYKPFPIMELPAEIRLEIYRACLTRPKKILLSKVEKPSRREESHVTSVPRTETNSNDAREEEQLSLLDTSGRGTFSQRLRAIASHRSSRLRRAGRSSSASALISFSPFLPSSTYLNTALNASNNAPNSTAITGANATPNPTELRSNRPKNEDALVVNILRTSKQIYKEARDVLYSENSFDLDINTAVNSLAALHQRSRRHIKHIELEIPTYTEILERFSEIVRLSLRYCTGLKTFVTRTPFTLPGHDGSMSSSNTTVYANGFDILRWLPQQCEVVLDGNQNAEIEAVVEKHRNLARRQDKVAYARRQLISNESERPLGA